MKQCCDCGTHKPLDQFNDKPSNADGKESRCRRCRNIRYKKGSIPTLVRRIYTSQVSNAKGRKHPAPSYTLDELQQWATQQPQMQPLFDAWVQSDYRKELAPSIDRRDPNLPYTLNNLQVLTWDENRAKGGTDKKVGIDVSTARAVACHAVDGSYICTYHSISEAARQVKGHEGAIINVANATPIKDSRGYFYVPRTHKGFIWKWP